LGYYFISRIAGVIIRRINWDYWYYHIYLKSTHWKLARLEKKIHVFFRYWGLKCEDCGNRHPKWFEVHHLTYAHIGAERMSELRLLCPECHDKKYRGKR
jgi:hypothetical protein